MQKRHNSSALAMELRLLGINSLAPGRFQFNFRWVIFKLTSVNGCWGISFEIALRWMPLDLTDDKSTLVQVMAWCRQATSHYLNQCWPRSLAPYGITRPQWVNSSPPSAAYMHQWTESTLDGSGNGLLPVRCQAITWTNASLLSIGPFETNFSEIWI